MFKKSVTTLLVSSILLGGGLLQGTSVFASEVEKDSGTKPTSVVKEDLSDNEISLINNYVFYDVTSQSFMLNDGLDLVLNSTKVDLAQAMINETNSHIQTAKKDSNVNVTVTTPEGKDIKLTTRLSRAYGRNDVKFYWNYARVFLSKGTVQAIGGGLSLAGIWIGAGVVAQVAASLGVGIPFIPHGIWFDYNYFYGVLGGSFGFQ